MIRRSALKRPQYNFKQIRANVEDLQKSVDRRGYALPENKTVAQVVADYDRYLRATKLKELVRRQQKALQVPFQDKAIRQDKHAFEELKRKLDFSKSMLKEYQHRADQAEIEALVGIDALPNYISPDAVGLFDNQMVEIINRNKQIDADPTRDHLKIALDLGLVDFESASVSTGASWYFLINDGALLEMALVQYALSKARSYGWRVVTPPAVVREEFTHACGFKPRDQDNAQQVYMIPENGLCLTGTAEVPLAAMAANKTIDGPKVRVVGYNKSYRAEAGARGRDTRGLYRVHEFGKVELFAWAQDLHVSQQVHDEILEMQKEIINDLGLCARVLNMAPFDLGAPAYKKYDIEAWMPGRGDWGEVTSTSNCLDYQSRRLHTKMKHNETGEVDFAHTLNGTAVAVPRLIIALLETHYDPTTERVWVPPVLRPYLNKEYIEKQRPIF
uniref:serine--tRNA ligase n=1 Tax=Blastobotrys adeninivorans TaxID=409370 RepID=A0A060T4W1_BLAAD